VRECVRACVLHSSCVLQAPAGMTGQHMYSSSSPHLAMGCSDPSVGAKVTH